MLKEYGFIRVGSCSNRLKLSNVNFNVIEILNCIDKASKKGIDILTFPELSLTGASLKDGFFFKELKDSIYKGIETLVNESKNYKLVFIIGLPLEIDNKLYNCAMSISKGKILGITPKTYLNESESKYFTSSLNLNKEEITLLNQKVKISNLLIYKCSNYDFVNYSVELGEDLFTNNSVSSYQSLMGSNLVFNLACSSYSKSKREYLESLLKVHTKKNLVDYVYCSSGVCESSDEYLYSGDLLIVESDGSINKNYNESFNSKLIYADIDLSRVNYDRKTNFNFKNINLELPILETEFKLYKNKNELEKKYNKTPFIKYKDNKEILNSLSYALARRVKQLGKCKMVIGISGGSDSTLAYLICLRVCKILKMDNSNIISVTMPGFGTSKKTYNNAINLIKLTNSTLKQIDIKSACTQHFKDIDHKLDDFDITYENSQARERTQILFDLANKENGIVIGTGDLSEIVLGWCTFNGDNMSNYSLNSGVPKTLVKELIRYESNNYNKEIKDILLSILDTIITPELLPLDSNGNIIQDSQKSLGNYKLIDFIIYHFFRYNCDIKKLYLIASKTFKDEFTLSEIKKTIKTVIKRFFNQQFKRNTKVDGISIGSINPYLIKVSSDLDSTLYLKKVEEL